MTPKTESYVFYRIQQYLERSKVWIYLTLPDEHFYKTLTCWKKTTQYGLFDINDAKAALKELELSGGKEYRIVKIETSQVVTPLIRTNSEAIEKLNIRAMYCKSGQGLMSYRYSYVQVGGFTDENVLKSEFWDGDMKPHDMILDCRGGKTKRISEEELNAIIEDDILQRMNPLVSKLKEFIH